MTQDLALGEVQSLAQKAARGAGRAVGVAEDAGRAVRWLCARGYDGAGALDALLRASDGTTAEALSPNLPELNTQHVGICPLILGGYLSDIGILPKGPMGPVFAPLLLAPALAYLAGEGSIIMQGQELSLRISACDLFGDTPPVAAVPITAHLDQTPLPRCDLQTRVDMEKVIFLNLQAFAARTYAPATEASRTRGAGAGTTDND